MSVIIDDNKEGNNDNVDGQGMSKPKKDLKRAALVSFMVYIISSKDNDRQCNDQDKYQLFSLFLDENDEGNDDVDGQGVSKPKPKKDLKRAALVSVMVYIMRQSYVLSLIAMMVGRDYIHE